jgi:hypothetical protein
MQCRGCGIYSRRSHPVNTKKSAGPPQSTALFGDVPNNAAGIACRKNAFRNVARNDAACTNDRFRTDPHPREDNRSTTYPYVASNFHPFCEFLCTAEFRVHGVHSRIDLNCGTKKGEAADPHLAYVEHDTIEIQEHALTEQDVLTVVAEEGRLHPNRIAASAEQLAQNVSASLSVNLSRSVQLLAEIPRAIPSVSELGIKWIVQLSGEHLLAFGHERSP